MRICKKCNIEKDDNEFRVANGYRRYVCKKCESNYQKEYYSNPVNKKKHSEYRKKYYEEHREEELKYATWYNRTQRGRSNKIVNRRNETPEERAERIQVQKEIRTRVKELEEEELEKLKKEETQKKIMDFFKDKMIKE